MILFSINRTYALLAFSPLLVVGLALPCFGPVVVVVVRRSERAVGGASEGAHDRR